MWWVDSIFSFVWDAAEWFYNIYATTSTWWSPFDLIGLPFLLISQGLRTLLTPIAHFSDWTREVWARVQEFFSIDTIVNYFRTWIDYATEAWNWIKQAWWNVRSIISDWWLTVQSTVLGWIENAKQFTRELLEPVTKWLGNLQESWDEFWTEVFPTLINVDEINNLLGSWFKSFENMWAGWVEFRDSVAEFFNDPFQWIYDRIDEFFERFW